MVQAERIEQDGRADFDFFVGRWKVHNRRLRERLKGSTDWEEFEGTSVARTHRAIGTVRETAPVADFSVTPASAGRAAPMPGEQTDELLTELRYTPEEIAALRAVGAVA